MWKSKREIIDTYVSHMESVKMSGLGHEGSNAEIVSIMRQTVADFEAGEQSPPFHLL